MFPSNRSNALTGAPQGSLPPGWLLAGGRSGLWYAAILAVPSVFVLYPILVLLLNGFLEPFSGAFTLKYIKQLFSTKRYLKPFYNTLFISFAATSVTLAAGVPLAFYLWIREFRGKRLLLNLLIIPYMMPVYIIALALILLAGEKGLIAGFVMQLTGNPDYQLPFEIMFTLHGILIVYVFHNVSLVIFLVMAFLSGVDRGLIEAARSLGAGTVTAIRKVVLPLAKPAVTGAAMLIFARIMVDYVVIETIGGFRHTTLAVEIYNLNFGFLAQELAAPLATLLALMTMGIMYSYIYLFRRRKAR